MHIREVTHRSRVAVDGEQRVEILRQAPGAKRDAGTVQDDRRCGHWGSGDRIGHVKAIACLGPDGPEDYFPEA
jgi:hypothetical protein